MSGAPHVAHAEEITRRAGGLEHSCFLEVPVKGGRDGSKPYFRAKAARGALKGDKSAAELVRSHDVGPTRITRRKKRLLDSAASVVDGKYPKAEASVDVVGPTHRRVPQRLQRRGSAQLITRQHAAQIFHDARINHRIASPDDGQLLTS